MKFVGYYVVGLPAASACLLCLFICWCNCLSVRVGVSLVCLLHSLLSRSVQVSFVVGLAFVRSIKVRTVVTVICLLREADQNFFEFRDGIFWHIKRYLLFRGIKIKLV